MFKTKNLFIDSFINVSESPVNNKKKKCNPQSKDMLDPYLSWSSICICIYTVDVDDCSICNHLIRISLN